MGFFNDEDIKLTEEEMKDMPDFLKQQQAPYKAIIVHFKTEEEMNQFAKEVGRVITTKTKSVWL